MVTEIGLIQLTFYLLILALLIRPLGWYIAQVYQQKNFGLNQIGQHLEHFIYKICHINPNKAMDWKAYLAAMLIFNLAGLLVIYVLQRFQAHLPLNPQHLPAPSPDLAFNTAISFVTNTNWQAYSSETTMSYFTQMLALTTQNFLSAATGMSLLIALIRGIAQRANKNLGNFWVDTVRGILYILLPLSLILALVLVSQGVIQNFKINETAYLMQPLANTTTQTIPMGPVASQVAISQLGTNGGDFFNTNSAHPFSNPTPFSNFLEMLAILIIPASFCYTYGIMIRDKRQSWALLGAMFLIFIPFAAFESMAEQAGNPVVESMGVSATPIIPLYAGGNMEGKEARFGINSSALWTVATTASSNGSVNSMIDSYTPLGGLMPLWLMHLGEVVFGGVGSGLYSMLMYVIITVFVTGLMVGRTPEYMGKKIEPFDMKMAAIAVLVMPLTVLVISAIGVLTPAAQASVGNPGIHGFTEIIYTFTSMGNNNGSAMAGLKANTPFYNLIGGMLMLITRYWVAIPIIALAGSLAEKTIIPQSAGTLHTHTPLFVILLIGIIFLVGALSFLPTLALGPITEHLRLWSGHAP